jgi:hypothetical protein
VTDLSNITLNIKGIPYSPVGNLLGYSFDVSTPEVWVQGKAVASFDGFATNFLFTDSVSPYSNDGNVFFYIAPAPFASITAASGLHLAGQMYYDSPRDYVATHWSLTTAVPEPETYVMMLAGLGLIGFISRRKTGDKLGLESDHSHRVFGS